MSVIKLVRCACFGLLVGCGGAGGPADQAGTRALGSAAALVNGEPIEVAEVRRLSIETGLAPEAALSRLVAERLLAQYAQARGYAADPTVRRGVAQAQVRALLAQTVEARVGARERNDVEARVGARERNDVEARAGARERNDVEARAGARERNDVEAPMNGSERNDSKARASLGERLIEERRRELARLLEQLALRTPVRYEEAAIRTAFAQ